MTRATVTSTAKVGRGKASLHKLWFKKRDEQPDNTESPRSVQLMIPLSMCRPAIVHRRCWTYRRLCVVSRWDRLYARAAGKAGTKERPGTTTQPKRYQKVSLDERQTVPIVRSGARLTQRLDWHGPIP